jgi:putative ABC transport system ATP-binding protein
MLKMEAVTKVYNHSRPAVMVLRDVSAEIPRGDFVSIVGPSGSGKSTLLLMLGGMLSPSSGRVLLDGESLYDVEPDRRAAVRRDKIGFVFQTFNLVPYLSALENVQIPLFLGGLNESDQVERASILLESVGLGDRLTHRPSELSVGQQQRVALARTLANDPAIILADEPTGSLDPENGAQAVDFLERLNEEGRTVVMVTHDPQVARRAKRTLRLEGGSFAPAA